MNDEHKLNVLNSFRNLLNNQPHLGDDFKDAVITRIRGTLTDRQDDCHNYTKMIKIIWEELDDMTIEVIFGL